MASRPLPFLREGVAFWALAEMVRQRLSIAEEEPQTAGSKLRSGLSEWVPDATLRARRAASRRLLGVETGRQSLPRKSSMPAGDLLRTAGHIPLRHCSSWREDLHYAPTPVSSTSWSTCWTGRGRACVRAQFCPSNRDRRAASRRETQRRRCPPKPLGALAMGEMLEGLVPEMPQPAKHAIAAHARGNPALRRRDRAHAGRPSAVVHFDGTYRLAGDVGELSVPQSLQSLLAA